MDLIFLMSPTLVLVIIKVFKLLNVMLTLAYQKFGLTNFKAHLEHRNWIVGLVINLLLKFSAGIIF